MGNSENAVGAELARSSITLVEQGPRRLGPYRGMRCKAGGKRRPYTENLFREGMIPPPGLCRATPRCMKTSRLLLVVALLGAPAAVFAAFQSVRIRPDNPMPDFPPALKMSGITRGRVVLALNIDTEGRVRDLLPLAYTDSRLLRASTDALRDWRFEPARLDGLLVPVELELKLDYTVQGAVISTNIEDHFLYDRFEYAGPNAFSYQIASAQAADQPPVRIAGESPRYGTAAEKDGVRGRVTVRFYIDENGNVRLPAVSQAGDPYLMAQALDAVRTWKFSPVTRRGQPVLVAAQQEFSFGRGP